MTCKAAIVLVCIPTLGSVKLQNLAQRSTLSEHEYAQYEPRTNGGQGVSYKDEDRLLGRQLNALANHIHKLPYTQICWHQVPVHSLYVSMEALHCVCIVLLLANCSRATAAKCL